jgi:gluconolactonase
LQYASIADLGRYLSRQMQLLCDTIVAEGLGFPEGPVFCANGIYLTEIRAGRVTQCLHDGTVIALSTKIRGPNGMAYGPDGALYVCDNGGSQWVAGRASSVGPHLDYCSGAIWRLDPATGEAHVLYQDCNGRRLSAPNDIVFDDTGGFWFTDMGKKFSRNRNHGGLYYALPDGSAITEVVYPLLTPNGCGLSPDGNALYVAQTEGARLLAFEVTCSGQVRRSEGDANPGRVMAGLPADARFDSLAILESGDVAVATLERASVVQFTPGGDIVRECRVPDRLPTNLCFGGSDMCTAWITLSETGRLARVRWPEPGLRLHFARD